MPSSRCTIASSWKCRCTPPVAGSGSAVARATAECRTLCTRTHVCPLSHPVPFIDGFRMHVGLHSKNSLIVNTVLCQLLLSLNSYFFRKSIKPRVCKDSYLYSPPSVNLVDWDFIIFTMLLCDHILLLIITWYTDVATQRSFLKVVTFLSVWKVMLSMRVCTGTLCNLWTWFRIFFFIYWYT